VKTLRRLSAGEGGATLAEYALLAGLIAAAAVTAVLAFGGALAGLYTKIATSL
jgi:Flp pilus assembly pilin Flp